MGNQGGGGVFLYGSTTLTNCEVIGNLTSNKATGGAQSGGGGVYVMGGGEIYNCRIISNVAAAGSAYWERGGGGVFMYESGAKMFNSIISGNLLTCGAAAGTGPTGGGVVMREVGTTGIMRNCLIAGNEIRSSSASRGGNGLFVNGGPVESCTIMDNKGNGAGGVYSYPSYSTLFINTIVQSNYSSGVISNWYFWDSALPSLTNCCIDPTNFPALVQSSGCITSSPQVINSAGGNYRLSVDSPCVNAGIYQSWMTTGVDLDGRRRIVYNRVDLGAYEFMHSGTIFSGR